MRHKQQTKVNESRQLSAHIPSKYSAETGTLEIRPWYDPGPSMNYQNLDELDLSACLRKEVVKPRMPTSPMRSNSNNHAFISTTEQSSSNHSTPSGNVYDMAHNHETAAR